jgi:bacteriorhodopsin
MNVTLAINSFYITYVFLLTTTAITLIEALRSPIPQVRHILNLETCISIIASYFYGIFIEEIKKSEKEKLEKDKLKEEKVLNVIPIEKINNMRYIDWAITTPLMLLVLSMVLGYENKVLVKFKPYLLTLFFNFAMLAFGYIGEVRLLNRNIASFISFIFLFLTYGTIWKLFMTGSKITFQSKFIFWIFVGTWSLYGLFYHTNETTKMIGYNILDLIAKALIGIFLWLYLTKSVVF